MQLHWRDIENDAHSWFGLAVEASLPPDAARKPVLRLETGDNYRIKLMQGETPLFWATACHGYTGVHLLKSWADAEAAIPASTIDSALVQKHAALAPPARLPAWSRVFARALAKSPASFLYPGLWMFAGVEPQGGEWTFNSPRFQHSTWPIYGVRESLQDETTCHVNWWINGSCDLLSLRRPTLPDDGRLKWWRKKAREQALPPILVWYLGCLDAYVIIDGHTRLQAAVLEDQPPAFIVAFSAKERRWPLDTQRQEHIVQELTQVGGTPRRKSLSIDAMNTILIAAFDDRPDLQPRTHAWATIPSETHWLAEVKARLAEVGQLDAFGAFANRTSRSD
nr:ParB/Srx family N-terminal domain-containing protein [uncultured Albidiferax sp.]